jgi:hypothetical protein
VTDGLDDFTQYLQTNAGKYSHAVTTFAQIQYSPTVMPRDADKICTTISITT